MVPNHQGITQAMIVYVHTCIGMSRLILSKVSHCTAMRGKVLAVRTGHTCGKQVHLWGACTCVGVQCRVVATPVGCLTSATPTKQYFECYGFTCPTLHVGPIILFTHNNQRSHAGLAEPVTNMAPMGIPSMHRHTKNQYTQVQNVGVARGHVKIPAFQYSDHRTDLLCAFSLSGESSGRYLRYSTQKQ